MNPQLEELACLYVLDRLDVRERVAFEARLPHDSELIALVSELETTLSRSIRALPRHEPPGGLLARIEDHIGDLRVEKMAPSVRKAAPRWRSFARWAIAAVIAVGVTTIALQNIRRAHAETEHPFVIVVGLDSLRSTLTELPMQKRPLDADGRFIQLASLAEQFWEKPEELPIKQNSTDQSGRGFAVFDPSSSQGFIAIRELPAAEAGKSYHLWILDTASGKVREAGVLPLNGSTHGLYSFSVLPAPGVAANRLNFFMTAEETSPSNSVQPHGKVVLGDKRI